MIIAQLVVAFVVAWLYYMLAMMMTVYDGILSMIFQPRHGRQAMLALASGS